MIREKIERAYHHAPTHRCSRQVRGPVEDDVQPRCESVALFRDLEVDLEVATTHVCHPTTPEKRQDRLTTGTAFV